MANKSNPDQGKGAPAAEQPAEKDVVGGESQVSKMYEKINEGASGRTARDGFVVYKGVATNRVISAAQWEQAGVPGQDDAGWTDRNGYAFPLDKLSDDAQQVLKRDGQFLFPGDDA